MKKIKVDKVILYYMDRVDPDGNPYRFYVYKGYGYNMCRETKKKLLQALKGVNVEEEDVSLYATGGWD